MLKSQPSKIFFDKVNVFDIDRIDASDAEIAFLQTQKALKEALNEQKVLKERLKTLESRNQPAKWGRPIKVQSLEATRGKSDNSEMSPDQLSYELKTAQHMLENAKRATEAAKVEISDIENQIDQLKQISVKETEKLLLKNSVHHKTAVQVEQANFHLKQVKWSSEKTELLSKAEKLSLVSHEALHNASLKREMVEQQRRKIQGLAADLRSDLSKAKELRELLDEQKNQVALIENLILEIDSNKRRADSLVSQINEHKMLLRAVRISAHAKEKIESLEAQVKELTDAKNDAQAKLNQANEEYISMNKKEKELQKQNATMDSEFKIRQMEVFILESEIKELGSEVSRIQPKAIEEGRKYINLNRLLKKKKMDATQRFLLNNSSNVHRSMRVQSSLQNVKERLEIPTLPPLFSKEV